MEPEDRKAFSTLRNSNLKTARAWALSARLPQQTNFATAIYFHCGGLDLMPRTY